MYKIAISDLALLTSLDLQIQHGNCSVCDYPMYFRLPHCQYADADAFPVAKLNGMLPPSVIETLGKQDKNIIFQSYKSLVGRGKDVNALKTQYNRYFRSLKFYGESVPFLGSNSQASRFTVAIM